MFYKLQKNTENMQNTITTRLLHKHFPAVQLHIQICL